MTTWPSHALVVSSTPGMTPSSAPTAGAGSGPDGFFSIRAPSLRRRHKTCHGLDRAGGTVPRDRFAGPCEGSWIESQSRRWRLELHRLSTPGAARKGKSMYIGIGTVVLIVIIVLVVLMLRRRLCRAAALAIFTRGRRRPRLSAAAGGWQLPGVAG